MRRVGALIIALAACLLAGVAHAGGSRQTAAATFTADRPDAASGTHVLIDYRNPDDPNGKPPAVRRVVIVLPRHTRIDPSVPGSCTASDAELMASGAAACPENSAIGGGVVTVDTGVPGPERILTADVEFFNNASDPNGEFIYLNTIRDSGARTVIRANAKRRRLVTDAGMLPGSPPDGGAIDTVDVKVHRLKTSAGAYLTTPPRCPRSGPWRGRIRFTYADDVRQAVPERFGCEDSRR
jgi:hypothetical protein